MVMILEQNSCYGGPPSNFTAANEHVPEIERRIRMIKERVRAVRSSLPFKRIPRRLAINMVLYVVKQLTFFPTKGGVSETLSPRMIMTGETLDYKRHLCLQFGEYCQVHEEDTPRNSMNPRTQGAICMGPSGNKQGGFKFMSLRSGQTITRRSWDRIPMPDTVIHRVEALAKGEPELLTFTDRKGRPVGEVELTGVDGNETPSQNLIQESISQIPTEPTVDLNLPTSDSLPEPSPVQEDIPVVQPTLEPEVTTQLEPTVQPTVEPEPEPTVQQPTPETVQEPTNGAPGDPPELLRRSTRNRKQFQQSYEPSFSGTKYEVACAQLVDEGVIHPDMHSFFQNELCQQPPEVVAVIMTQLSLKAGLKAWKEKGYEGAFSEMKQLHMRDTFRPRHWKELTPEQRAAILESHLFLKKKRCGKIKGRAVAGGNKQRDFISKEDASSPTVATESVLLTCIVDALEGRDVAVIDIPNAFIQTRIEDEKDMVHIRIRGILVDMLLKIAPDVYGPYVTTDKKGVKQLIVQCLNAIYGTMVASLLYYEKFCKTLTRHGFKPNPYDPCVWNRMVENKQQTICFHVDDCKLSHVSSKVNDALIEELRKEYESIFEDGSGAMSVSRGPVHTYLGMTIDFSTEGQCKVSMPKYIEETLAAFGKAAPNATGTKSSAAPKDLFIVNDKADKLDKAKAEDFHSLVAKMLFAAKRARPDTGTAVSFLTTRVKEPDVDDWRKLSHLMRYVRGTKDLPLILSADGTGILKWYVDGSYGVHPNLRGHTGGGLTLGRGFPVSASTKQKLNTRSSTESEVVGVDDLMPSVLWTRLFLEAQDYGVQENIVFQDNRSAMLLEKNGKASSGKRTKHINIRYFFVTDRIKKGDLKVEWCPTDEMIADFWTKPNQGSLFRKFRDRIMGVEQPKDSGSRSSRKPKQ